MLVQEHQDMTARMQTHKHRQVTQTTTSKKHLQVELHRPIRRECTCIYIKLFYGQTSPPQSHLGRARR